jgi:OmpA-OmpF porin, OOP family
MDARMTVVVASLLGAALLGPTGAQAQSTPNADSIVKSLTPTDNIDNSTRGIRIGNGAAEPSPTAAGPGHAAIKTAAVSLNIQFATGSDELTPQAIRALDQLGQALGSPKLTSYHFRIEGHTDTVGTVELNKSLSERRADTVVKYLTTKYQIDPARLQAVGMGEDGLLIATPAQTPEARNRRVLVVNIGS